MVTEEPNGWNMTTYFQFKAYIKHLAWASYIVTFQYLSIAMLFIITIFLKGIEDFNERL